MPTQRNSRGDFTIDEFAEEIGASRTFVRKLITEGHLSAYRIRGSALIRIPRDALDEIRQPIGGGAA